jgi:hypothetical protein
MIARLLASRKRAAQEPTPDHANNRMRLDESHESSEEEAMLVGTPITKLGRDLLSEPLSYLTPPEILECRRVCRLFKAAAEREDIWRSYARSLWGQGVLDTGFQDLPKWARWVRASMFYPYKDAAYAVREMWRLGSERHWPAFDAWRMMVFLCCVCVHQEDTSGENWQWRLMDLTSVASVETNGETCEIRLYKDHGDHLLVYARTGYMAGQDRLRIEIQQGAVTDKNLVLWNGLHVEWERAALNMYHVAMLNGDRGPFIALPLVQQRNRWLREDVRKYQTAFSESSEWFN